jgi:hypothetical protein
MLNGNQRMGLYWLRKKLGSVDVLKGHDFSRAARRSTEVGL